MARSRVTGDFGKLRGWQELFENGDALMEATSRNMAEETIGLVKDGFRSETDPYGSKWAPKQAADGRKVLSGKTSRLKGGWHVVFANGGGFRIAPSVNYAAPHQSPRMGRRPRRMMVPTRSKGLPDEWSRALEDAATDTFRAYFSSGGGGGIGFVAAKIAGVRRSLGIRMIIRRAVSRAARGDE